MSRFRFFVLLLLFGCSAACFPQAGYLHVELQGGYELFHDMSGKSGYDINIGCRYTLDNRFFAACMLHGGINDGTYEGIYAGEPTRLDHTMREYMIGVGPGVYLYNGGNRWIFADVMAGYGFGEELKSSSESETTSLDGFAASARLGAEYQMKNGWVVGANVGGYLVGGTVRPAVNLKWGMFLNL